MALTDLTRISTSGIATGSTIDAPILRKDVSFHGSQVGVTSALFDSSDDALEFNDNVKLKFGNDGDLEIYHNGADNYIDATTGSLYFRNTLPTNTIFQTGNFTIKNQNNSQNVANFAPGANGGGLLYHENVLRFNTTSSGAVVSGVLTATSFSGGISGDSIGNVYAASGISTFYDLRVSNNLTVEGTTTTLDTNLIGVDRVNIGANSNTHTAIVGIQSGSADIVNLLDGTTEVLTVKDGGNVGLGTDNPSHKLDISGDGVAFPSASGSTLLRLRDSAGTATLSIDAAAGSFSAIQFGDTAAASMGSILYNHVDDSMKFNTAGTGEKLLIKSNGTIGINTTYTGIGTGTTKLAIQSTATSGAATSTAIRIGNNMNALTYYPANLEIRTTAVPTYNAIRTDAGDGNGGFTCGVDSYNGFLDLTTGGTRIINVKLRSIGNSYFNGGNLGIGTETPGAKLSIMGGSIGSGAINALELKHYTTNNTGDGTAILFNGGYQNNAWAFAKISATNWTGGYGADLQVHIHPADGTQSSSVVQALSIIGDGSSGAKIRIPNAIVGIGTDDPKLNLHIHEPSSNASFTHFTNTTTGGAADQGLSIGLDSDENAVMYHYGSNNIRFATANTQHMVLRSTGQLGIGTAITPPADAKKLTVICDSVGDGIHIGNKENLYPAGSTGYSDIKFSFYDYLTGGYTAGGEAIIRGRSHNAYTNSRTTQLIFMTSSDDGDPSSGNATEKVRITHDGDVAVTTRASSNTEGVSKVNVEIPARTTTFSASDGDTWHDILIENPGAATDNAVGLAFQVTGDTYHKNAGTGIAAVKNGTNSDYGADLVFITRPHQAVAEERLRIHSDGKVKIGSGDASLALLHIAPADYSLNLQNNSSNKSRILFTKNGTSNDARSWIDGNGESNGYLAFAAGDSEKLRITSDGVGIGITNPTKTGIQNLVKVLQIDGGDGAEIILGNSTSQNVSTNHIGAIAFKNIDTSTGNAPHYAGIRCNTVDTSGNMNLKFYTGTTKFESDTPQMTITSDGVICGEALINRSFAANQGNNYWTTHGAWKVVVDLNSYPNSALYICDAAMQFSSAYTATFWVYKTEENQYKVIHDQDSLLHWRINGSQLEVQQNSGVDQTDTSGYQKVFRAFGMAINP